MGGDRAVEGAGGKVAEGLDLVSRNASDAEAIFGRVEEGLGGGDAAVYLADAAMDGGSGLAVELLVEDGFKQ